MNKILKIILSITLILCIVSIELNDGRNIVGKVADNDFLLKQKFIMEMLQHVDQKDIFVEKYDQNSMSYKPWEHLNDFKDTHLNGVKEFLDLWQHQPFPDTEIYATADERLMEYSQGLSELLYSAVDWKAFTRVVYWARRNVPTPLFVYAFHFAVIHRADLQGVGMPAIYEILPNYFFGTEILKRAQEHKMQGFPNVSSKHNQIYNLELLSNYSNAHGNYNEDHVLSYFREDIGLNAFYYYYNIDYAHWARGLDGYGLQNDRRGELYFYLHGQLLARYYLERLSNGLGEVPRFNLYNDYQSGYVSDLEYLNGVKFPDRENCHNFYHEKNYQLARDYEILVQRILDVMDRLSEKSTTNIKDIYNTTGNHVQRNGDASMGHFHGNLDQILRQMVNDGRPFGEHGHALPSTLMHYETSLRDPLFYSIYKEILSIYWQAGEGKEEYQPERLQFDGVELSAVKMPEELITYFESFNADISNAVQVEQQPQPSSSSKLNDPDELLKFGRNSQHNGQSFVVKARQLRLNHKPFDYQLSIISNKNQKATVKVFMAPKYDENGRILPLTHNYQNFFELDHVVVDLVDGVNTVKRSCDDFEMYVNDRTTYLELYKKMVDATFGSYKFPVNQAEAHCGIPRRLMLPRGHKGGFDVQFFYIVYPYHAPKHPQYSTFDATVSCGIGSGSRFVDNLPFGYPFNLPIWHEYYFQLPNMKFVDVKIYHKDDVSNVV